MSREPDRALQGREPGKGTAGQRERVEWGWALRRLHRGGGVLEWSLAGVEKSPVRMRVVSLCREGTKVSGDFGDPQGLIDLLAAWEAGWWEVPRCRDWQGLARTE